MERPTHALLALGALGLLISGCAELNQPYDPYRTRPSQQTYDPYYYPPSQPSYGGGYYDGYRGDNIRRERREIERERDRLEAERDALEQAQRNEERRRREEDLRNRYERDREREQERERPIREVCPSGFSPSEQKCSPEERRRGCKDMRLPGGLGCVRR